MSDTDFLTPDGNLLDLAEAGAAFLDQRVPSWFVVVNPRTLDLGSGHLCVLGQLGMVVKHEPCERHVRYLAVAEALGVSVVDQFRLGFVPGALDDVVPLTVAWLTILNRRRCLGPVDGQPVDLVPVVPASAVLAVA